ncbi:hypothetical protein Kirov_179 [Bacillus phage Kirov]|uniref:Uncharacterized protein n=1 Tax=Bacillus phage Kirov TaxID=2783539 RepID=A0A7U3NKJ5_9CAUD|nr:hypothetical protein PQE67_gp125 [Bacillus phage Kirov]QOV08378.1 hypothetical protein Kirov_179 [Bacillus phage Kirov]
MDIFTKEELLKFNEFLLGRGRPVQQDGIGYNKADFGACKTYYNGLSDSQFADLAKRLVKYSKTQLKIDKEKMEETARQLASIASIHKRSLGVSIARTNSGTLISFRYNDKYIEVLKKQPVRKYDKETQCWIVPNHKLIEALQALDKAGADVANAIAYAKSNILID